MNFDQAVDVINELLEIARSDRCHFNISHDNDDDGSFTRLYMATSERSAMIKVGRGSLKNYR